MLWFLATISAASPMNEALEQIRADDESLAEALHALLAVTISHDQDADAPLLTETMVVSVAGIDAMATESDLSDSCHHLALGAARHHYVGLVSRVRAPDEMDEFEADILMEILHEKFHPQFHGVYDLAMTHLSVAALADDPCGTAAVDLLGNMPAIAGRGVGANPSKR